MATAKKLIIPTPTAQETSVSKPTSYFSIKDHTFKTMGRKENKGKTLESTEKALFLQDELFVVKYKPLSTVTNFKEKYVKESGLHEIVGVLESGYPEDVTSIVLREKGYKELVQTLKDNKILTLDFCQWVSDEVKSWPAKTRGTGSSKPGKPTIDPEVLQLAQAMRGLAPHTSPAALRACLVRLVEGEEGKPSKLVEAQKLLEAWENDNDRDKSGYILQRVRGKAEETPTPTLGTAN